MTLTVASSQTATEGNRLPDLNVCLAFGVYTGLLCAVYCLVGAIFVGVQAVEVVAAVGATVFVVGTVAGSVAVRHWENGPKRVGNSKGRYAFMLPAVVLFVADASGWVGSSERFSLVALFGGFGVLVSAAILVSMSRTRYVRSVYASSPPEATWTAKPSERARWLRFTGAMIAFGVAALTFGVEVASGYANPGSICAGIGGALLGSLFQTDTVHAHSSGLEIEQTLSRDIVSWGRIDGYELTADELRLRRPWRPDYRYDRAKISNVETVVAALDRHVGES